MQLNSTPAKSGEPSVKLRKTDRKHFSHLSVIPGQVRDEGSGVFSCLGAIRKVMKGQGAILNKTL
jgi:hypothetical protein